MVRLAGAKTFWGAKLYDSKAYCTVLDWSVRFINPRCAPANVHLTPLLPHRRSSTCFQQDGASVHTSNWTRRWLQNKGIRQLNQGHWPAMSPDLNPVEHIWPMVLRKLDLQAFSGPEDLWTALQAAFASITPASILRLYDSLPRRLVAVMDAKGGHTRY